MPDNTQTNITGPEVSTKLFGGILESDGAGHYPGLELLNFVFGNGEGSLPKDDIIRIKKRGHDFARMLVWDDNFVNHPNREEVLIGDLNAENTLKSLLECIQLEIPNIKKDPSWERAHFFPYSKSLIHWDARNRRGSFNISLERRYLRGSGAFAFRVLRMDPIEDRLSRCEAGFNKLFPSSDTPLENLSSVLSGHGAFIESEDDIENKANISNDPLEDLFRDGMVNILEHDEISTVLRIRGVMNWTAFWLILAQHCRAADALEEKRKLIICDCLSSNSQLRRASQRCLKELLSLIFSAVEKTEADMGGKLAKKRRDSMKGFYSSTAATIKLLNSFTGRRHFTLGLDILETLVLACCTKKSEMPYPQFVHDWLFEKCRIVVGRRAAESSNLSNSYDISIFEDNENALAKEMAAAGLATNYSDQTIMVGTGGLI